MQTQWPIFLPAPFLVQSSFALGYYVSAGGLNRMAPKATIGRIVHFTVDTDSPKGCRFESGETGIQVSDRGPATNERKAADSHTTAGSAEIKILMPSTAAKAKKHSTPKLDAPTLAWKHISNLQRGKTGYKQADAAFEALMKLVKPGDIVTLPANCKLAGKKFLVIDKFEKKISIG